MTARKTGRFCKCGRPLPLRAVTYCGRPECYRCIHGKRNGWLCVECKGGGICPHSIQRNYCPRCDPKGVYRSYRNSARKRNLAFTITFEEFQRLITTPCIYCGQYAGGVDRSDATQGYTTENSLPCCGLDNLAKQSLSRADYLAHIQRVHKFQQEKRNVQNIFGNVHSSS